jgi:hypothetical protein
MTEKVEKMTQKAIKNQLESVAAMSAFYNTLISKTKNDNVALKLGDQLRPTNDYNGSLFEVVREPYWCWISEDGLASEMAINYHHRNFHTDKDAAVRLTEELACRLIDPEHGCEDGVWDIELLSHQVRRTRPQQGEGWDDLSDDEDDFYPIYLVEWKSRETPVGCKPQQRVWVRKICIISKAEGHSDDKNARALPFPVRTLLFRDLVIKEIEKLSKIARCLERTETNAKRTRKVCLRTQNKAKLQELRELWLNDTINKRPVTGFYSEKYGLFLKSDVKYEVSTTHVNPVTALLNSVKDIKEEVKEVVQHKRELMSELKSTTE